MRGIAEIDGSSGCAWGESGCGKEESGGKGDRLGSTAVLVAAGMVFGGRRTGRAGGAISVAGAWVGVCRCERGVVVK